MMFRWVVFRRMVLQGSVFDHRRLSTSPDGENLF